MTITINRRTKSCFNHPSWQPFSSDLPGTKDLDWLRWQRLFTPDLHQASARSSNCVLGSHSETQPPGAITKKKKNVLKQIQHMPFHSRSFSVHLQGFGAGNFKSLFEAIEADQQARGNLTVLTPNGDSKDMWIHSRFSPFNDENSTIFYQKKDQDILDTRGGKTIYGWGVGGFFFLGRFCTFSEPDRHFSEYSNTTWTQHFS